METMNREVSDNDFITKTKHRRRNNAKQEDKGEDPSKEGSDGISLRPRNLFAMKGRGRAESENATGSPYRPQWSKDGDGFVSSSQNGAESAEASGQGRSSSETAGRRKSKVLRYTREELLSLHFQTSSPPTFPPETVVASEHSLPPVGTLPFDYEEIYKQWAMNRNRGRGRGRGTNATATTGERSRSDGKWEENKWDRTQKRESSSDDSNRWKRGGRVPDESAFEDDSIWDDVGKDGAMNGEMDLTSMAEAAEKFRLEMDALRMELEKPVAESNNLDAFDQKLEDAAKSGQFEDSDEETEWEMPEPASRETPVSTSSDKVEANERLLSNDQTFGVDSLSGASIQLEQQRLTVEVEVKDEWFYLDPQGLQQGPFKTMEMREWFEAGYFKPHLPIRFGQDGGFTPLANHFVQGQLPFASIPRVSPKVQEDHQRMLLQQQQQQQLQQQQQQERERQLRITHEETMRMEMQRMEAARQQHHNHMLQQHAIHQQHQHMLLQQQTSWQRNQREGILSALGIFGGGSQEAHPASSEIANTAAPMQFPGMLNPPHQHPPQATPTMMQEPPFVNQQPTRPMMWGGMHDHEVQKTDIRSESLISHAQHSSGVQNASASLSASSMSDQSLLDTQNSTVDLSTQVQRHEATTQQFSDVTTKETTHIDECEQETSQPSALKQTGAVSPRSKREKVNTEVSPVKNDSAKNVNQSPWKKSAPSASGKSLREIQEEEQREMRRQLEEQNNSESANLAQMGAQLRMMLGVQPSPMMPAAQASTSQEEQAPQQVSASSSQSPWNTAKLSKQPQNPAKSMRDILAEEERLAQERAKLSETAPTSSHWMSVVAGAPNPVSSVPKPSRSLGPVPASVLKSSKQLRSNPEAARKPSATPDKSEADASFWNFDAGQSAQVDTARPNGNAFSSKPISNELMTWCVKQLENLGGVGSMPLMEYCATLEDPGEIREYIAAYLGSTPRVSAFATEFIQKKKQVGNTRRPSTPSAPVNTSVSASEQQASGRGESSAAMKKTKRRTKGQKVDPSLLNYSVGSN